MTYKRTLFTARKRSCGKVMFSQMSVSHSDHGGGLYTSWDRSHGKGTPNPPPQDIIFLSRPVNPILLLCDDSTADYWQTYRAVNDVFHLNFYRLKPGIQSATKLTTQ